MAWIIWQAKTYASQLAGVGVEGAMQGAAAMGLVLACSALPGA
nr:pilus assembly protein [Enterobacter cloacae complex sp.]